MRKSNITRIISGYNEKMKELGTREARDNWCAQVEQELGCSIEEREDGRPPGLLRVRKLENDILNVVSLQSVFLSITKYLLRLSLLFCLRYTSSPVLSPQIHATL